MTRCPDSPSPVRQDFERVALAIVGLAVLLLLSGCAYPLDFMLGMAGLEAGDIAVEEASD